MMDDLGQAAFSAYFDGAGSQESPHQRLQAGSRAAAQAVVGVLRDQGLLREALRQQASHGTQSGYDKGCRCRFCTDAKTLGQRANNHWKKVQGDNKVRI